MNRISNKAVKVLKLMYYSKFDFQKHSQTYLTELFALYHEGYANCALANANPSSPIISTVRINDKGKAYFETLLDDKKASIRSWIQFWIPIIISIIALIISIFD